MLEAGLAVVEKRGGGATSSANNRSTIHVYFSLVDLVFVSNLASITIALTQVSKDQDLASSL